MTDTILSITELNKRFSGVIAAEDVTLNVRRGEIHALIGPNGAGKTTLVSLISGILQCDSGMIEFNGVPITTLSAPSRALMGLARSFQVTSIFKDFTCQENVALAIQAYKGHSFKFWHPFVEETEIQQQALKVLELVGMLDHSNTVAGNLAYGEQRHLEIAIALAMDPKLLVLDEPLAGMGKSDSVKIVEFIRSLKKHYTIFLIEHDMDAVFSLADHISVMVYGRVIASGTPESVRQDELVRSAYLGEDI